MSGPRLFANGGSNSLEIEETALLKQLDEVRERIRLQKESMQAIPGGFIPPHIQQEILLGYEKTCAALEDKLGLHQPSCSHHFIRK